jgi:hypothetical protein
MCGDNRRSERLPGVVADRCVLNLIVRGERFDEKRG